MTTGEAMDRLRAEQLLFRWIWRDEPLSFDDYCWLMDTLPRPVLLAAWDDATVVKSAEVAVQEGWLQRLNDAIDAARRRQDGGS